jgi:hypothetical protein
VHCNSGRTVGLLFNVRYDVTFQIKTIWRDVVIELYFNRSSEFVDNFQIGEVQFTRLYKNYKTYKEISITNSMT